MPQKTVYEKAVDHFGIKHQLHKLAEECSELAVEAHHVAAGRGYESCFAGEIADVEILIDQMKAFYPKMAENVDAIKRRKVLKLITRIEKEENDERE